MTELKKSVFMEKLVPPSLSDVQKIGGNWYYLWNEIMDYINANYPLVTEEWSHSGKKYGWSFRLRSKKRVVIYFTPLENSFRVAFALGPNATDAVLAHPEIPFEIKKELLEAQVYIEGSGLRIEVCEEEQLPIINEIIKMKMEH